MTARKGPHAVGVYLVPVRMIRRPPIMRAYVVLEYAGKPLGKLAIDGEAFAAMRADGVPLIER